MSRALDALVAEKVMGWNFSHRNAGGDWWVRGGETARFRRRWQPSKSIAEAKEVLDKMISMHPQEDVHIEHLGAEGEGGWCVAQCYRADGSDWPADSWLGKGQGTLELAICHAALLAVGVSEQEIREAMGG